MMGSIFVFSKSFLFTFLMCHGLGARHKTLPSSGTYRGLGRTLQNLHGHVPLFKRPVCYESASAQSSPSCQLPAVRGGGTALEITTEITDDQVYKSTLVQSCFNLVKNICGAGMLSLPAGVAAFSSHESAVHKNTVFTAMAIIALMGGLSGYTFSIVGRTCRDTGAETYEQCWAKGVSEKSAHIPAIACVATCFAGCLSYTIIASDTLLSVVKGLVESYGICGTPSLMLTNRNLLIGFLSAGILLPLSLMKNLSSLGFTSMLGTGGLLYTAVMMLVRYFDGSYGPSGKFTSVLPIEHSPAFATKSGGSPLLFLVLISMLGTAYEAHFNAPLFHKELKDNTPTKYNVLVGVSFAASIALMSAFTFFGFRTFGTASQGFILNNYANQDVLAGIARIFVGFSILFTYPLCFVGMRDGILELKGISRPTERQRIGWTIGLLSTVSLVSVVFKDLGFINSFFGALIANSIIYIFPSLMSTTPIRRSISKGLGYTLSRARRLEFWANYGIITIGVFMGLLGAVISVLDSFTGVLG